jgi:hypothetical protein
MVLVGVRREAVGSKLPLLTDRPALHLPAATRRQGISDAKPGPLGLRQPPPGFELPEGVPPQKPGPALNVPTAVQLLTALGKSDTEAVFVGSGNLAAALRPFLLEDLPLDVSSQLSAEFADITGEALARQAPLEEGGTLIIDEAEALTAIDVDLGRSQAQSARGAGDSLRKRVLNELGRTLSLRGIGGQVVLDLPRSAMRAPKVVRDGLTAALKPHGLVSIPAVTKEGLVVLIMGRNRPSLLEVLTEPGSDDPLPGRRLKPAVEAWGAFDRVLRAEARGGKLGPVSLSPAAAESWRKVEASAEILRRKGAAVELRVTEPLQERPNP